ncbi:MAG: dihydrodipicolinate synthase family protein [Rubrivivax sp.]
MNLAELNPAALPGSVLAVPPLARRADLTLDGPANRALIRHIEAGGVRVLLYGGNANLYHQPVSEFGAMLDLLADAAGPGTWVIPSIGPDYGKMVDQAAVLRRTSYRTAMVLPMSGMTSIEGVEDGLLSISDAAGMPLTVYLRSEDYLSTQALGRLVDGGHVWCVKYAIGRTQSDAQVPRDTYLEALIERIGAARIVSGMGERPVLGHVGRVGRYGLASFTTGGGCIAPRTCMALLAALHKGDADRARALHARFMPLEALRESLSLVRVLHDAVTWSGVADMGAQLPLLSPTPASMRPDVEAAARALLAGETAA